MSAPGKTPPGVSMAEIAARAGVSVSTVARVLNASGGVSSERRRAVQEAVNLLTGAAAPDGGHACAPRTIGVLVQATESSYFDVLLQGIETQLAALGYTMLCVCGDWSAREEAEQVRALVARRVAGVILPCGVLDDVLLQRLAEEVPIVVTGRKAHGEHLRSLSIDNCTGALIAVRHLLALGHRRIAHIAGPPDQEDARERLAGYKQALEEAGLRFDPNLVVQGGFLKGGGLAAMHALLERATAFTAVFAANDLSACGARQALLRYGIRVPDDISLIGFDDAVEAVSIDPPLTTIRQPVLELGRAAATQIVNLISGASEALPAVPPLELVVRGSTRRLR
ncbi:substrate-binding domain-containing protein [Niveibacterium sp.]|uniref:substrate-binding domain-containing protein n=1 Tax=Niveibacterium sp. TaxID=2017444 RepID=UPI0035B40F02